MTLLLALLSLAQAEEPEPKPAPEPTSAPAPTPPDPDGWIDLSVPTTFGSALDHEIPDDIGGDGRLEDLVALDPKLAKMLGFRRGTQLRGRWGLRPHLGFVGLPGARGGWGADLGVQLSHQWWSLREATVKPVGETRLLAAAPVGGVKGWELALDATAGVWFGPLGLLAGPALRAERWTLAGGATLAPALLLGPTARIAGNLGAVSPWVGVTPSWILAGDREGVGSWYDELRLEAGIAFDLKPVGFRLQGCRWTHEDGAAWSGILGLHLRLL